MPNESNTTPASTQPPTGTAFDRIRTRLSSPARQHATTLLVIVLVAGIAYSNTLVAGLRSDERALIESSLDATPAFTSGGLAVGVESRLFGYAALPYRVVSIFWQVLAAFGVFCVARRLTSGGLYGWFAATLAAVVFAAHPAATQTVNALAGRGALMSTALVLFGAATMLCASALPDTATRRWTRAALSCAFLCAAWVANPAAVLAAPLLPAIEYAARRRVSWPLHVPAIAFLVLLTILRGVDQALIEGAAAAPVPVYTVPALQSILVPVNLLVHHAPTTQSGTAVWIALLIAGSVAFALRPALGAGLLWLALAIRFAPVSGDPASFDETSLHLALAGVAIVVAFVLDAPRAPTMRAALVLPGLLVTLGCIALTSTRNNLWRSEAALWLQAAQACPTCAAPLDRLGRLNFDQALRELSGPAAQATPTPEVQEYLESAINLLNQADTVAGPLSDRAAIRASAMRLVGRTEESDAALRTAFVRQPVDPELLLALAQTSPLTQDAGRNSARRAARYFRAVAARSALDTSAQLRYAQSLAALGDWGEAAALLDRVGGESDTAAAGLRTEVAARLQAAQSTQALYYQAAARVTAADRAAIQSAVLDAEGHYQLAAHVAWHALARYPEVPGPWRAAGIAEQHMGRLGEFIEHGIPASLPGDPDAVWGEFARYLAQVSEWAGAERVYRDALAGSEFDACLRTAALARELNRLPVASNYLQRAAALDTSSAEPWIQLAEIAIDVQQQDAARDAIANAEQRGASPEVVTALKTRAGVGTTDAQGLRRTIIR